MKRITGLMNSYEEQGAMGNEAALSKEEQRRVLKGVMLRIQENTAPVRPARRWSKTRKLFAVAAAALLVTGAGVVAAERFSLGDSFAGWMGSPPQEQIEALRISGHPLDLFQTAQGVTVALQGVIGEKNTAYLLYDVQLPEGQEFPETDLYLFENQSLMPEKSGAYGYHSELMSKEGNTLHFCLCINSWKELTRQQVVFSMDTLKHYNEDTDRASVIAEGPWSFEFPLNYSDTSVKIPMKKKITPWGEDGIAINGIQVSPIAVHLECSRPVSAAMEQESLDTRQLMDLEIRLCFGDGSVIDGGDQLSSGTGSQMLNIQVNRSFRKLIDLEELVEIQIIAEEDGENRVYSVPVESGK